MFKFEFSIFSFVLVRDPSHFSLMCVCDSLDGGSVELGTVRRNPHEVAQTHIREKLRRLTWRGAVQLREQVTYSRFAPWHFLNFLPEPQGQGSFLPQFA